LVWQANAQSGRSVRIVVIETQVKLDGGGAATVVLEAVVVLEATVSLVGRVKFEKGATTVGTTTTEVEVAVVRMTVRMTEVTGVAVATT